MFATDTPAQRMNPSPPSFQLNIYHGTTFVDTFVTDCREDFDEVIAFADAVKRRGREERKPVSMDMLPQIKRTLIATVLASIPRLKERRMELMPKTIVFIEACDMDMLQ